MLRTWTLGRTKNSKKNNNLNVFAHKNSKKKKNLGVFAHKNSKKKEIDND